MSRSPRYILRCVDRSEQGNVSHAGTAISLTGHRMGGTEDRIAVNHKVSTLRLLRNAFKNGHVNIRKRAHLHWVCPQHGFNDNRPTVGIVVWVVQPNDGIPVWLGDYVSYLCCFWLPIPLRQLDFSIFLKI